MYNKKHVNPVFNDFQYISPKQVTFAMYLVDYRRRHNFSTKETAKVFSMYGKPENVKITNFDISMYERYKLIPTPKKFQVIMQAMDLSPDML